MNERIKSFEIISRAVIIQDKKILLCKAGERDYYFFPGGHVEFGEKAEDALKREIWEELGISVLKMSFLGAVENIFKNEGDRHEVNLVFKVDAAGSSSFDSREKHLKFNLVDIDNIANEKIYPIALKESVIRWIDERKIFWNSQS